jgi:hypothetical protein
LNIQPGSSTVVLGSRGTFKTTLSIDFLVAAARKEKQNGLLISLMDHKDTIENCVQCPRKNTPLCSKKNHDCLEKKMFLFPQRPGCVTPAEFIYFLKRRLDLGKASGQPIKRAVFWDLTQIDFRFPLMKTDAMFLPALIDLFTNYENSSDRGNQDKKGIASLFIGAANASYTQAVSAMADNVVFCWRDWKTTESAARDCLMLYVDRVQGKLGNEGQKLYSLPVEDGKLDSNAFKLKGSLDCSVSLSTLTNQSVPHPYLFARDQIDRINRLQGLA